MVEHIEIQRNKNHLYRHLLTSPIALYLLLSAAYSNYSKGEGLHFLYLLFLLLASVFTLNIIVNAIQELRKSSPALIINKDGITDHISNVNAGLLTWATIRKYEIIKTGGSLHLFIFVEDPEAYLDKAKGVKKMIVKQHFTKQGSPIAIALFMLKSDTESLIKIIDDHMEQYKAQAANDSL